MSIRSTVKALIINDGKVLLNRCHDEKLGDYFSLPGGGQHKYETLEEAVIRECREETGYEVTPVRLAALCETIFTSEEVRQNHPEYAHKIYHVFVCELADKERGIATETDSQQVDSCWVDVSMFAAAGGSRSILLFPEAVRDHMHAILAGTAPVFLGSNYLPDPVAR